MSGIERMFNTQNVSLQEDTTSVDSSYSIGLVGLGVGVAIVGLQVLRQVVQAVYRRFNQDEKAQLYARLDEELDLPAIQETLGEGNFIKRDYYNITSIGDGEVVNNDTMYLEVGDLEKVNKVALQTRGFAFDGACSREWCQYFRKNANLSLLIAKAP